MDKNKYDYLIVGAGISGLVIAERLASIGKKVLILEKRKKIGGNCYDYFTKEGVLVSKYGPHIFRTDNETVWNYIKKFSDWIEYKHKVLVKYNNKYLPFPININTINSFLNHSIVNKNDLISWIKSNIEYVDSKNFEEEGVNVFGRKIYKSIIYGYTKKQWGVEPNTLSKELLLRIPIRMNTNDNFSESKYQFQPKNGFTKLFINMINNKDIDIKFNTDFIERYEEFINFDNIIYTGKIDDLYNKLFSKNERLKYRSLKFKYKKFNVKNKLIAPVINYADLKYKFTRVADYGYIYNQKSNKTVLKYEYPSENGVECYPFVDEKNKNKADEYKNEIIKKNNKIILLGRLATYKYLDMDKAVESSLELFNILKRIR